MDYITISDVDKSGYYPLSKQLFNNKFYQKKVKKIKTINDKNGNSKKILKYIGDGANYTPQYIR